MRGLSISEHSGRQSLALIWDLLLSHIECNHFGAVSFQRNEKEYWPAAFWFDFVFPSSSPPNMFLCRNRFPSEHWTWMIEMLLVNHQFYIFWSNSYITTPNSANKTVLILMNLSMVSCVYKVIFVFRALYTIYNPEWRELGKKKKHCPQQSNKENSCLGTVKQMIWLIPGQAQVGASLSSLARSKKINVNEEFSQKETLI